MSKKFQRVMLDISQLLKDTYRARSAVIVPGSGSFGMEAVTRQFAAGRRCLILRNGWFSFRWSQILEMGGIASDVAVLKARPTGSGAQAAFAPAPIAQVVAEIERTRPELVFAPHVETSSGILLPDDYLRAVAEAVHAVGGMFVLDCIASGAIWVDMAATGVDVLISAPQKGWSGPACCAFVMLGPDARERIDSTTSSSFSCDLRKWLQIMEIYEKGGHLYHATMPTDALAGARDAMQETQRRGMETLRAAQQELGRKVRAMLAARGYPSVAAAGFEAPGVVVCYTADPDIQSGRKLAEQGLQIAAGVPLQCDEPADFRTFRVGLFGLDKLENVERTVGTLEAAFGRIA
jgi:aspartate aminotransferase-like enzyme